MVVTRRGSHMKDRRTSDFRGRDAGCPAPPAQIRTCALTHTAPTSGATAAHSGRRIRSAACVTVPRLGVRPVLWPRGFPSVTGLGSGNSATARYRLVRCLHRYYAGVRLLRAVHHRLRLAAFPTRSHRLPARTTRRPPRSRRGVYVRAWGLRRREVRLRLAIAAHPMLPSTMRRASALRTISFSTLNTLPTRTATDASPAPSRVPLHGSR